jgi:hypothetical protein
MRFTDRDGEILSAIHQYDGVLAKRQLKRLFWPAATWRAMEMRLAHLHAHGYVDWPNRVQRQTRPIPEPVCWLGWKGVAWLAGQRGITVPMPETPTETHLRRLERGLRQQWMRWVREPRWAQLAHDLAIVEVRLALEQAVRELPHLTLETWVAESEFHLKADVVEYTVPDRNSTHFVKHRRVMPDGYFVIADEGRERQGLPARARFLLEVDRGTHDTTSFFEEKVVAGLAYLHSPAYLARFGGNNGRWLVVTTSEARLKHLMSQVRTIGADMFWFTTLVQITATNPLTAPIWWQPGGDKPVTIIGR